jgi:hypothetical protein
MRYSRIKTTPVIRNAAPANRTRLAGCTGMPTSPKWSKASEQSIWPVTRRAMKVAAPSCGISKMASAMKMAPNSPPLHAYQGMRATTPADGTGSRRASANTAMQIIPTR